MRNSAIDITTVENGFIVTVPVTYKPMPRRRMKVDTDSDPALDMPEVPEQDDFKFHVRPGVHVFHSYEKVLAFLSTLADAERVTEFQAGASLATRFDPIDYME